jgi:hypothetical protein
MKQAHSDSSDDTDDDSAFAELEGGEAEDATEDEIDDNNEVDPAVETSDFTVINQVAAKINAGESLPTLTGTELKIACFSLSKVYYINYISSTVADYLSDPKPCEANLQQPDYSSRFRDTVQRGKDQASPNDL